MQDHCSRIKTQSSTSFLNAPANIDVVPSNAELGIETADRLQPVSSKCHVTSGDVLRFLVRDQHMGGSARCVSNASRHFAVIGKRDVRATYACGVGLPERQC